MKRSLLKGLTHKIKQVYILNHIDSLWEITLHIAHAQKYAKFAAPKREGKEAHNFSHKNVVWSGVVSFVHTESVRSLNAAATKATE